MLNEPILGLLPASEGEILSAHPGVYPDSVLSRLRRLERASVVKKRKDGRYVAFVKPPDEEFVFRKGRKKPKPAPTKVCIRCGQEKNRLTDFPRSSKWCYPCRPPRLARNANKAKNKRLIELKAKHARQMAILRGE